jgi:death-on-curing protein
VIEDGGWLYLELSDVRRIMAEWSLSDFQDARKVDSACARPRQTFGDHTPYTDAASKAAALGWGLVRAHGLVDGNKRLGAIATLYFLNANGYDVAMTQGELLALYLQVARGLMDQEELCLFLRSRMVRAPRLPD